MPKKYSFNVEEGRVVSVEVDGVVYASPDDIPDEEDRHCVEMMMPLSLDFGTGPHGVSGVPVEKIVAVVFFVVSAITLSVAVFSALHIRNELVRERSVSGRVTEMVVRRDSDGDELSYPVIEFTLPDGTAKSVEVPEGTSPPSHTKGEAVTVLYDPEDPADARIDSLGSTILQWILPMITGTIGLVFTAVTLAIVRFAWRGSARASSPQD